MNGFKKFIGTTLAALMVAGCGTLTFAKSFDDVTSDSAAKTEISILTDIGVIKGTHENEFSPDENVTREQMAAFLFRLMLGRDDAGRVNTTSFRDLYEPYYNGAISWAYAAGYILGTSKTTFEPTGGITKQDAMTMLVRALGQDNDKMNEGYPWSYINAAVKLGLDKGLEEVAYDETLTRAETAVILYNALTSEYLVERITTGGHVYLESTSIIEEVFDYNMTEATVVSTNDYTIEGETVVKSGYVTLEGHDEGEVFRMVVPFAEMNLDGRANDYLGMNFRVIFSAEKNKYTVLSAVPMTRAESYDTVKIENGKVTIGVNKYTLVDEFSDELSTNNNELKLFAYDGDGTLSQIETTAELSELLGFYKVTLLYDDGNEVANRALLRNYEMDQLMIDESGKINIGGNKTVKEITVNNYADAFSGDYVLYYYNADAKELEIFQTLEVAAGTVKRITNTTAKIGDESFSLGNAAAGISADSIRNKLVLGTNASVVLHKDAIVAVIEGVTITDSSQYLLALSDAHRIYEDGTFRYVMTAFIDGEEKNVYVKDGTAREGKVYRYTETTGVYSLIEPTVEDGIILSGRREFIQNGNGIDEIAYIIESANGSTVELSGRNYYTLNKGSADAVASVAGLENVRFVCDKNTVIVVNDNGVIHQRSGVYSSTITVNDGANVVAIFDNEVGAVESLKYLYISDGSLGNYDLDAQFVRILAQNGLVYENGTAYVEYLVFNFATGKTETMLSREGELTIGQDYRCGNDNTITPESADVVMNGFVTGYTGSTVSIDGSTFTLDENVKILRINGQNEVVTLKLSDLYMRNVEFMADHGVVTMIIEGDPAQFEGTASGNIITVTPDFDLANFEEGSLTVGKIVKGETEISVEGATAAFGGENTIVITLAEGTVLEAGEHTLTFKLGNKTFTAAFTATAVETPETPESPETPETPEESE